MKVINRIHNYDNADEVIIKELFEYIFNRHQIGLET